MRGLYNFDRDLHRLLSRPQRDVRGLQGGALRLPDRGRCDTLALRTMTSPPRAKIEVIVAAVDSALPKVVPGFAFNTRRSPVRKPARFARPLLRCSISNGSTPACIGGLYRRSIGFSTTASSSSVRRPANAAERALLEALPGGSPRRRWKALSALRSPTAPRRDRGLAGRALDEASARRFRAEGWQRSPRRWGGRSRSRFVVKPRRGAAGARLSRIRWRASALRPRSAWSTRPSSSGGATTSTSTWPSGPGSRRPRRGAEQRGRWGSAAAAVGGRLQSLRACVRRAIDADDRALVAPRAARGFRCGGARARSAVDFGGVHRSVILCASAVAIAYWRKLGWPERTPLFGVDLSTWWRREP